MFLRPSAVFLWAALLCLGASMPASANTITVADAQAAKALNGSLIAGVSDIEQARQGVMQAGDLSQNSDCLEHVQSVLMIVQGEVEQLAKLFFIGAKMVNVDDEAAVLEITKLSINEFLFEAQAAREEMNRLSGVCSKFPLPVAKALRSIELIDSTMPLVKSVSKRFQ